MKYLEVVNKFLRKNWQLLVILAVGTFLRLYGAYQNLDYGHDQDLESWFVRDVLENRHLRLIGQETSTQGVFIGPIYYYLLTFFYLVFGMSPVGGIALATILGIFSIWSFYFVFTKMFGRQTGIVAAFFYSVSFATVYNDRGVVPTTPVFAWTVWYFYSLNLILNAQFRKGLILSGILIALIWHLNVGLVLLTPLLVLSIFLAKGRNKLNSIIGGIVSFFVASIPFFAFELRHGFSQIRYVITSFTTNQGSSLSVYSQFQRVVHIATQNATTLIYNTPEKYYLPVTLIFVLIFVYLIKARQLDKKLAVIMLLWQIFYVLFFTFYSKNLSEYYLNGMTLIWIAIVALFVSGKYKNYKTHILLLGLLFVLVSFARLRSYPFSSNGYVPKMELISEIKKDASDHGYPCISISYITNPGYDRGYRYLFLLQGVKLKPVSDKIPVYSIVFPLKKIFVTDKNFGTIGLIYPDHKLYSKDIIDTACVGEDFNVVDSMIGFTN